MRTSQCSARCSGVAGKRAARGQGTVYKEEKPNRKTTWVAERWVTLPDGRRKRVRARAASQGEALAEVEVKARRVLTLNPGADRVTVADFMVQWLEHKSAHVRASSMRAYRQDVRLHIRPALGKHRLARLQTQHCQALVDKLVNAGTPSMADRVRRTLKQALRHAVKWGLLAGSPMDRVDPVRKPAPKRATYDAAQLRKFLRVAEGSKFHPLFLLAVSTGMRKGELLALKWEDLQSDGVHVRRTVSAKASGDGTTAPKTAAGERFVPVAPATMRVILETRTKHAMDSDWVFTTRNGKRHSVRTVSRVMRTLQKRYGLPEIRFHDFRRSYATLLAEQGHHPRVIQALLGHSTPTLAMTVYTDVTEASRRRAHIDLDSGGKKGGSSTGRHSNATGHDEGDDPPQGRSIEA